MTRTKALAITAGSAAMVLISGCAVSGTAAPAPSSACTQLGGTVGSDGFCEVHDTTTTYTFTSRFPTDYPDQQPVADYLSQERADLVDFASKSSAPARTHPFEIDIVGKAYQSGDGQTGTRSLVLDIGDDTGVHPVTLYKTFNYRLADHAPVTFQTLFKPGSDPLAMLNPIVRQQVLARDPSASVDLTAASYEKFAITDDAIIFFFNQDGLLPHDLGPLEVSVPRKDLASVLA